jgi:hypothetical protein
VLPGEPAPIADGSLLLFGPGGPYDAQHAGGQPFNIAYTPYANYAFGIYAAASGLSLTTALGGANLVASQASYSPLLPRGGIAAYPSLLDANYVNIVLGYYAYKNGNVCTHP